MSAAPSGLKDQRWYATSDPVRQVPFGQPYGSTFEVTFPGVTESLRDATFNQTPRTVAVSENTA